MKHEGIFYNILKSENINRNLLLLHGLTGNKERWDGYIKELNKSYNLILIDLIGHGQSISPKELKQFSAEYQAKTILNILKKEKISNSAIICHSCSFNLATKLIELDPLKFSRLIMISPFFEEGNSRINKKIKYLKFALKFWNLLPHLRKKGRFNYPKNGEEVSFWDYKKGIEEVGIKTYLASLYSALNFDNKNKKFILPSLVVYKEDDNLFTSDMLKILKSRFQNLSEKRIKGKGHLFLIQDKKEILKVVRSFSRM